MMLYDGGVFIHALGYFKLPRGYGVVGLWVRASIALFHFGLSGHSLHAYTYILNSVSLVGVFGIH